MVKIINNDIEKIQGKEDSYTGGTSKHMITNFYLFNFYIFGSNKDKIAYEKIALFLV